MSWRLCVAAALLSWLAPRTVAAQLVEVQPLPPEAVRFVLTWPQPAEVATEQLATTTGQGSALLLRLDQPLDGEAIAGLQAASAGMVVALSYGYDTLLLDLAPGVRAEVLQRQGAIWLTLRRGSEPGEGSGGSSSGGGGGGGGGGEAALRLRRLKASLLWSLGEIWQARQLFEALRRDRPDDPTLWRSVSQAEARLGRWRNAVDYADEAQRLVGAPTRGPLPLATSAEAPRVVAEGRFDSQDGVVSRRGVEVDGHAFVAHGTRLTLGWALADSHRGAEAPATLPATTRHRFAAGLRYDSLGGSWLAAQALATLDGAGGLLEATRWDAGGDTTLRLAWAEPRWTLPLLAAAGARRDGVDLSRSFRALPSLGRPLRGDVRALLSASLERWRAADGDANADAVAQASLHYVSWRARPRLGVDYVARHTERLGAAAAADDLLGPLVTRSHVHSLTVTARFDLWRWLAIDGNAGYALDLIGGGAGPTGTLQGGAGLSWSPPTGPLCELRYQRGVQSGAFAAATSAWTARAGLRF